MRIIKSIVNKFLPSKNPSPYTNFKTLKDEEKCFKCMDCEKFKYYSENGKRVATVNRRDIYRCAECERLRDIRVKKKTEEAKEE